MTLEQDLIDALLKVPGIEDCAVRTMLLDRIGKNISTALHRNPNPRVDLGTAIRELKGLGRLDNGERPVVIIAQNARRLCGGTELGREFDVLVQRFEAEYGGEPPPADDLPDHLEVLPFGGDGEWVATTFLEHAHRTGGAVARLRVPYFEQGVFRRPVRGVGTGWLIGPGLLLTNHHVVAARTRGEPEVSSRDFERQALKIEAWFDYHVEGGEKVPVPVTALVAANETLDYAVLRLTDDKRAPLPRALGRPVFHEGMRLNIVQCPGGGPLRYAIRNNFFVAAGSRPERVRYVTDTLQGSSGAPILDDDWQVVAMHRGYHKIDPAKLAGDAPRSAVVKFLNEGVVIADILADLPSALREEIEQSYVSGE
ncbi:trypsin-like serine peptidase [Actinoplanes solisilvae]|uniref:trypsin-like serine peptidase n=1 Tax=Actinoplanes solisilvae TaxID=2486853 RepID=UPI000FDC782A|nr:serine protease [Actinoplanes solisilvae]